MFAVVLACSAVILLSSGACRMLRAEGFRYELSAIGGGERYNSFSAEALGQSTEPKQYSVSARLRPDYGFDGKYSVRGDYYIAQDGFNGLYYGGRYADNHSNMINGKGKNAGRLFQSLNELNFSVKTGELQTTAGRIVKDFGMSINFRTIETGRKYGIIDPRGYMLTGMDGLNMAYKGFEAGIYGTNECKPCAVLVSKAFSRGGNRLNIVAGELTGFWIAGLSGMVEIGKLSMWADGSIGYNKDKDSGAGRAAAGVGYLIGKYKAYAEYYAASDGSSCKFCYDLAGKLEGRREYAAKYYIAGGLEKSGQIDGETGLKGILNMVDGSAYISLRAGKKLFNSEILAGIEISKGFGNIFDEFYYYPAGLYLYVKYYGAL